MQDAAQFSFRISLNFQDLTQFLGLAQLTEFGSVFMFWVSSQDLAQYSGFVFRILAQLTEFVCCAELDSYLLNQLLKQMLR